MKIGLEEESATDLKKREPVRLFIDSIYSVQRIYLKTIATSFPVWP